jgi:hypothetical protein
VTVTISGAGRRFQLVGVGLVLVALAIALFARPAAAAITGTATPSTGLENTGTMVVTGSGFATGTLPTVHVLECEHGATDSSQCDANTDDSSVSANPAGNYSNPAYAYYALPNAIFGISDITCDATHACDLLLIQDDYNNFSNPHVLIPLTFTAVAATTTEPPTTIPASTIPTTATTATTAPTSATTAPSGDPTTTAAATAGGSTTTTTAKGGSSSTLGGQGSGSTLPAGGNGFSSGSSDGSGGSGGTLPFTGPPTAAPIIAICGIVIVLAGTLMRRVVLNVPDAGVRVS